MRCALWPARLESVPEPTAALAEVSCIKLQTLSITDLAYSRILYGEGGEEED